MNKEQRDLMVQAIAEEPMLCKGSWEMSWAGLGDHDKQFFVDHIDGNVKVDLPPNVNCAMGSIIDKLNESGGFNGQTIPQSGLSEDILSGVLGITRTEQDEIIGVNDQTPVERRKKAVIEKIDSIFAKYQAS